MIGVRDLNPEVLFRKFDAADHSAIAPKVTRPAESKCALREGGPLRCCRLCAAIRSVLHHARATVQPVESACALHFPRHCVEIEIRNVQGIFEIEKKV